MHIYRAPRVHLIAHTTVDHARLQDLTTYEPRPATITDSDELPEFAGRNCYLSFDRPSARTAANRDYLANITELGHESVYEHASASFYVHTTRSVLTELERHRHLSFSVVSQRYVDVTELGFHVPSLFLDDEMAQDILDEHWRVSVKAYNSLVDRAVERGAKRKQAREAARDVLPSMIDSPMVISGNMRAWRYVLRNRFHVKADKAICAVAGQVLAQLREIAPGTFADFPDQPFG